MATTTTFAPRTASSIELVYSRVGHTFLAFSIACGSKTWTAAPARWSFPATSKAGESRISSLLGLKAAPRTATFASLRSPPTASRARSTTWTRRRRLTSSISRKKPSARPTPSSSARAWKARISFGKHPPPNPIPAPKNLRPMRSSNPIASAS